MRDSILSTSAGCTTPADYTEFTEWLRQVDAAEAPPTDEQAEREYADQRCDEQALCDRYPGLHDKPDAFLAELVAHPPGLMGDADEAACAAAIILHRRGLAGALAASVALERALAPLPEPRKAAARRRARAEWDAAAAAVA